MTIPKRPNKMTEAIETFVASVIDDMPEREDYSVEDMRARFAIALSKATNESPAPQPPVEGLREALDNSQSLLAMVYHLGGDRYAWKVEGVSDLLAKQMDENRAALASPSLTAGPWRNDDLPETGQWIDVRAETTFRYLSYKPNSEQRRKGIKGRWQRSNGYGGWENCERPTGDWRLNLPLAAPATLIEQSKS